MGETKRVREAVAVFDDVVDLDEAVRELFAAGFTEADLSLLAGHQTVESKLGHTYERIDEVVDDPATPRVAYHRPADPAATEGRMIGSLTWAPPLIAVGAVAVSTGLVTGLVIGAAVAGTLAASVFGHVFDRRHADWLQDQLDRGGILLWVRVVDDAAAAAALPILTRHAVHDVHLHEVAVPGDQRPT